MILNSPDEYKLKSSQLVPLDADLAFPANDAGPTHACCPTCGKPWAPFSLRASGILDNLALAQAVLRDVITLVEDEVLP
jgi:hypothetical protein